VLSLVHCRLKMDGRRFCSSTCVVGLLQTHPTVNTRLVSTYKMLRLEEKLGDNLLFNYDELFLLADFNLLDSFLKLTILILPIFFLLADFLPKFYSNLLASFILSKSVTLLLPWF